MGKVEIYALLCPNTKEVRYIGKANDSEKRLKSHIRDSRRRNTPVYCWIKKLSLSNQIPIVKVLHICNVEEWKELEINVIKEHKEKGCRLLNVALGGDEPFCSKEQRAENGRSVAKMINSDPQKKRIWQLKKYTSESLIFLKRRGFVDYHNRLVDKCKQRAISHPHLFSKWSTLQHI